MSKMIVAVLVVSACVAWAQSGPCSEQSIRQMNAAPGASSAHEMTEMWYYSMANGQPLIGMDAIRDSSKEVRARRKNQEESLTIQKVDVSPDGNMAYAYGSAHVTFDEAQSGKHHDFNSAFLQVWKADGGQCKAAAMMYAPIMDTKK